MSNAIPDTFWTTQEELLLFGGSVLLGIPAGILFDLWRILRRLRPQTWGAKRSSYTPRPRPAVVGNVTVNRSSRP